jgi:DNA-binding CsgD family transcriptional regulator
MSLDDGLSKFLGGLYEAVHHREGWQTAIAEIMRRTDSRMFVVSSVDLRKREYADIQFHGPQDSSVETGIREYAEEMAALDPTLGYAHENPAAGTSVSTQLIPGGDYCNHPFIKWSKSRFGSAYWRAFYEAPVEDLAFAVSFHQSPDAVAPSQKQVALQAHIFENLERAVRLASRPPLFADDDSALISTDAAGRPLSLSHRAEELIRIGDGLLIRDGLLTLQSPDAAHQLQRALRAAVSPHLGDMLGRGIRVSRRGGKPDLLVVVSPFPPSIDHLPSPTAATLVRVVELEMRPGHLREHAHLFDLTPRETEIASALLEGHSINSLSEFLGISRNTARNHLQVLFQKTRTNRQSELIRILDRVARQ